MSVVLALVALVGTALWSWWFGGSAEGALAKGPMALFGKKKKSPLSFVPVVGDLIGGSERPSRSEAPAISPAVATVAPPPAEPAPAAPAETAADEEEERRRRGRVAQTILTGAQGVLGSAPVQRKSLLGA